MEKEKVLSFMKQYWKMDDFIRNRFEEYMDYCYSTGLKYFPKYTIDYWDLHDNIIDLYGVSYGINGNNTDVCFGMPIFYLYDENWKEDVDKQLIEKKRKEEERKQVELLYRAKKEEEECKLYETLKKKYE